MEPASRVSPEPREAGSVAIRSSACSLSPGRSRLTGEATGHQPGRAWTSLGCACSSRAPSPARTPIGVPSAAASPHPGDKSKYLAGTGTRQDSARWSGSLLLDEGGGGAGAVAHGPGTELPITFPGHMSGPSTTASLRNAVPPETLAALVPAVPTER